MLVVYVCPRHQSPTLSLIWSVNIQHCNCCQISRSLQLDTQVSLSSFQQTGHQKAGESFHLRHQNTVTKDAGTNPNQMEWCKLCLRCSASGNTAKAIGVNQAGVKSTRQPAIHSQKDINNISCNTSLIQIKKFVQAGIAHQLTAVTEAMSLQFKICYVKRAVAAHSSARFDGVSPF